MNNFNIDFVGKKFIFAGISGLLVIISIALLCFKGLTFGIDFSGGTLIEFKTNQVQSLEQVRAGLKAEGLDNFSLQEYGSKDEYIVKLSEKISNSNQAEDIVKGIDSELRRLEYVGPQIGKELAEKGILATIFALIAILIYISFRFQLRFALGAVIALFHDVVLTLGIFALMGKEFSLPVLAAVLTIIGYSLNDTIVVYDRIRENMAKTSDEDDANETLFSKLINLSINSTLRRTFMTSFTTFVVLLSLYLFGGQSINDFAFALLFGVVVGTYSSIFVASPILIYLRGLAPKPQSEKEQEVEDFSRFNKHDD
jgi:preprotein translocase subunit SecF